MSDTKSALVAFGGKLLKNIEIDVFMYLALVCFLFGVIWSRDSRTNGKI